MEDTRTSFENEADFDQYLKQLRASGIKAREMKYPDGVRGAWYCTNCRSMARDKESAENCMYCQE